MPTVHNTPILLLTEHQPPIRLDAALVQMGDVVLIDRDWQSQSIRFGVIRRPSGVSDSIPLKNILSAVPFGA
jgi:hypothetical protein